MRTKHPEHRNPSDDKLKKTSGYLCNIPKKPLEIQALKVDSFEAFIKFRQALA